MYIFVEVALLPLKRIFTAHNSLIEKDNLGTQHTVRQAGSRLGRE